NNEIAKFKIPGVITFKPVISCYGTWENSPTYNGSSSSIQARTVTWSSSLITIGSQGYNRAQWELNSRTPRSKRGLSFKNGHLVQRNRRAAIYEGLGIPADPEDDPKPVPDPDDLFKSLEPGFVPDGNLIPKYARLASSDDPPLSDTESDFPAHLRPLGPTTLTVGDVVDIVFALSPYVMLSGNPRSVG
ncbi:hypothetical protein HK102_004678, partial [Quaeritorhiza haematococci]